MSRFLFLTYGPVSYVIGMGGLVLFMLFVGDWSFAPIRVATDFPEQGEKKRVTKHQLLYQNTKWVVFSPRLKAFDLDQEMSSVRDRYGRKYLGGIRAISRWLSEATLPEWSQSAIRTPAVASLERRYTLASFQDANACHSDNSGGVASLNHRLIASKPPTS